MLNGALVGCGFFADNHLNAWREVPGAKLVAVCDSDPDRLARAKKLFEIPAAYTDIDEMLAREQLDFVDVVTGPHSHRVLVEKVAAAGVPAICQKPIAKSWADAVAMVEACEKAGVPFMIHENFRWETPLLAVKQALDEGLIGEPFFGRVSFRTAYDVYAGQPYLAKDERFIVEDLGVHVLDVARYLFGDVASLSAATRRVNPNIRGEDTATALLAHQSGVTSVVDCSYTTALAEDPFPQTLVEIDGSLGTIRLDGHYQLTIHNRQSGTTHRDVEAPLLDWAERPWHVVQDSVRAIQRHFIECLEKGVEPATSGRDNLKTFALVEAVYRSAAGPLTRVVPDA